MIQDKPLQLTVSHLFGELTWLFTQSPKHNGLPIAELIWQLMPAIARRQFHLFREGERAVGVAIWALLDERGERSFIDGQFYPPYVGEEAWDAGDRLWLINLLCPFANDQNKQADVMFGDLVTGAFKGRAFKMLYIDPESGERHVVSVDADTGQRLSHFVTEHVEHIK